MQKAPDSNGAPLWDVPSSAGAQCFEYALVELAAQQ
jgi:hypothetical protein